MRSMTGFGRAEVRVNNHNFTIEIKSVNHRFLDVRFRLPNSLNHVESTLVEYLRGQFDRGSFEINIKQKPSPQAGTLSSTRFVVDELAAKTLIDGAQALKKLSQVDTKVSLEFLAATGKVFIPLDEVDDAETTWPVLKTGFEKAVKELKEMRENEGSQLKTVLRQEVQGLKNLIQKLTVLAPEQPKKIHEKLKARVAQWTLPSSMDSQRFEQEVVFYAERSDVAEELERLKIHAQSFLDLVDSNQAMGRRLDFLTQELHREINTLSSKASLIEMTQLALEAKASVERLREQLLNVE